MRVLKTLDLIPNSFYLSGAIIPDLLKLRRLINHLPLFHYLHQQPLGGKVSDRLTLPGVFGVKYLIGLCVVNFLVVIGESIRPLSLKTWPLRREQ